MDPAAAASSSPSSGLRRPGSHRGEMCGLSSRPPASRAWTASDRC